jgi:protein-tyrosine phosphatase
MNGYVDFHSGILPNVGIKCSTTTIDDAIDILNVLQKAKIKTVVATPCFHPLEENLNDFLEQRDKTFSDLSQKIEKLSVPRVILGAEVLFTPSLLELDNIDKLCIGETKYIILALPYQPYSDIIIETLQKFIVAKNLHPIIAHIERYLDFYTLEQLQKISSLGVLMQLSCNAIIERSTRKSALELLSKGVVQIVGSNDVEIKKEPRKAKDIAIDVINKDIFTDIKDISTASPQYSDAIRIMRYHLAIGKYKQIKNNAGMIISNANIKSIMS